jgi:hypothetical protein
MGVIQWSNNVKINATSRTPVQDISVHPKKHKNSGAQLLQRCKTQNMCCKMCQRTSFSRQDIFPLPSWHGGIFFISFHPSISGKNPALAPALRVLIKGGTMMAEAHCEFMGRERERPPHNY